MLAIHDPRTGQPEPVAPARRGQLHTYLAAPETSWILPGDLRPALVADLVRRAAVRRHVRVVAWQGRPPVPAPAEDNAEVAWRAAWEDLNIYPAQFSAQLPDPLDVAVAARGTPSNDNAGQHVRWVRPGAVWPGEDNAGTAGVDPLALRLAFLREHYRKPFSLSRDGLISADRCLREWRLQVADWACSPSKPMCAQYVGDVTAALDSDLDAPAALRTLQALADDSEIPPGSKFEAFAYLDQLVGLDLAREVGR